MIDSPPVAVALARHLATIEIGTVSGAARRNAIMGIVDTVGVTLAGASEPAVDILFKTLLVSPASGPAVLFGREQRASVLDAALINGTAAHALDYDDMATAMGGHPSVPVVPVVFALGEALHASGLKVLEAYIVGFEAECRLGRVVHPHHYESGWHPTATLGVFGAAAAAARLLGLNEARMAIALSIAASLASGVKSNFGTMTKPLHVGNCAHNGTLAAMLAKNDFSGNLSAFEGKEGFFAAFDGLENVHIERMLENTGLEVARDDIGLKQFPCCGSTHPAILAMLKLVREHNFASVDVEAIEIATHRRRLPHTNNPDPKTELAAKFSIQYVTIRALLDRTVRLKHFEDDAYLQPEVSRLLAKTTVQALPPDDSPAAEFAAEVTVKLTDGRRCCARVMGAMGRGPSDPMTDEEMFEKFGDCVTRTLTAKRSRFLFEKLYEIEKVEDIADLCGLLSKPRNVDK